MSLGVSEILLISGLPNQVGGYRPLNDIPFNINEAPALRRLGPGDLLELIQGSCLPTFAPGEVIVREGEAPQAVFLLLSGQVSVRRRDSAGREYVLALRESGNWFGELGVVRRAAHPVTAVAETTTRAVAVPKAAFVRLVLSSPAATGDLLEVVANRLVESEDARLSQLARDQRADGSRYGGEASAQASASEIRTVFGESQSFQEATRIFQAGLIQRALEDTNGNVSEASRRLGIARSYFYKLLSSLRVPRRPRPRPDDRPQIHGFEPGSGG